MIKIKPAKYFLWHIDGVSIYCHVIIVTKIKPGKNLTSKIFYQQKIPDLWYTLSIVCAYKCIPNSSNWFALILTCLHPMVMFYMKAWPMLHLFLICSKNKWYCFLPCISLSLLSFSCCIIVVYPSPFLHHFVLFQWKLGFCVHWMDFSFQ